jgi:hypothetical protein
MKEMTPPNTQLSEIDKIKLGIEDAIVTLDGIIIEMQGAQGLIKSWIKQDNGNTEDPLV